MRRKKIGYIFPLPLAFATEIKKWNLFLWYTLIILRFPKDKNDDRKILWKEVEISEAWNCCHLGILRDIHTNTLVVHRYKNHWCQIIELSGIFVDCSHTLLIIQNKEATYYTMIWYSIFIFLLSNIVYLRTLHYGRRKWQNFKWFHVAAVYCGILNLSAAYFIISDGNCLT